MLNAIHKAHMMYIVLRCYVCFYADCFGDSVGGIVLLSSFLLRLDTLACTQAFDTSPIVPVFIPLVNGIFKEVVVSMFVFR